VENDFTISSWDDVQLSYGTVRDEEYRLFGNGPPFRSGVITLSGPVQLMTMTL
jgi:hypothetical protein